MHLNPQIGMGLTGLLVIGLMGCSSDSQAGFPIPVISPPPTAQITVEVSDILFNSTSESELATVQVRAQGLPLSNTPVDWSLVVLEGVDPDVLLAFTSSVTDENGIAVTKLIDQIPPPPEPGPTFSTDTQVRASALGSSDTGQILFSSSAGDGADYADAQTQCSAGDEVILTTPVIPVNGILAAIVPPSSAPSIAPQIAIATALTTNSDLPEPELQVTLLCLSPGTTTILLPGTNAVGELEVEVQP